MAAAAPQPSISLAKVNPPGLPVIAGRSSGGSRYSLALKTAQEGKVRAFYAQIKAALEDAHRELGSLSESRVVLRIFGGKGRDIWYVRGEDGTVVKSGLLSELTTTEDLKRELTEIKYGVPILQEGNIDAISPVPQPKFNGVFGMANGIWLRPYQNFTEMKKEQREAKIAQVCADEIVYRTAEIEQAAALAVQTEEGHLRTKRGRIDDPVQRAEQELEDRLFLLRFRQFEESEIKAEIAQKRRERYLDDNEKRHECLKEYRRILGISDDYNNEKRHERLKEYRRILGIPDPKLGDDDGNEIRYGRQILGISGPDDGGNEIRHGRSIAEIPCDAGRIRIAGQTRNKLKAKLKGFAKPTKEQQQQLHELEQLDDSYADYALRRVIEFRKNKRSTDEMFKLLKEDTRVTDSSQDRYLHEIVALSILDPYDRLTYMEKHKLPVAAPSLVEALVDKVCEDRQGEEEQIVDTIVTELSPP